MPAHAWTAEDGERERLARKLDKRARACRSIEAPRESEKENRDVRVREESYSPSGQQRPLTSGLRNESKRLSLERI